MQSSDTRAGVPHRPEPGAAAARTATVRWGPRALLVLTGLLAASCAAPSASRSHSIGAAGVVPRLVVRVMPAVVSIATRQIERDQFNQPVTTRGLGSGFIVDRRGIIVTSNHVVEGAQDIKVTLTTGEVFRASLVGADRFTDLAVITIDGRDLPTLQWGHAGHLAIGETVIAVGNPLWIEGGPTVTVGVVSALGRSMEQPGLPMLHNLIQTDAAINAGNSGGPLVNLAGQVVGINSAVIPSAHGIGFAIPANGARPVIRQLMAAGSIERASLGVEAVSVTPQVAYANDLPIQRGALVIRVEPGGPGEGAGLTPGDVITSVGGRSVTNLHHFHQELARRSVGQTVDIAVWREGQTLSRRAVLGAER